MRINAKSFAVSGLLTGCAAAAGATAGTAVATAAPSTAGNGAPAGAPGTTFIPLSGPGQPHRCTYTGNTGPVSGDMPNISACSSHASFLVSAPRSTSWKGWLWSNRGSRWTDYGHGWRTVGAIGDVLLESNVAKTTIGHAQATAGGIRATETMY